MWAINDPGSASTARQVAVVAVRRGPAGLEVCLIRRKDSVKWAIPKGFIDRGDTPERAALNEAFEEAGLVGRIVSSPIGTYEYEKWNRPLTVAVYLMEVLDEQERWMEMGFRERRWLSLDEAERLLSAHPVRAMWEEVKEYLARWRDAAGGAARN